MKYVEFYKLQDNGTQKIILTCELKEGGEVECNGDEALILNLNRQGVRDYDSKEEFLTLYPKDGLKFLEQLKLNFTSGYLNASDVLEK